MIKECFVLLDNCNQFFYKVGACVFRACQQGIKQDDSLLQGKISIDILIIHFFQHSLSQGLVVDFELNKSQQNLVQGIGILSGELFDIFDCDRGNHLME